MRLSSLSMASVCVVLFAVAAQAQEVKRQQVQAVDYKTQAAVAVDSMAADLAALDASNAEILAAAEGLASLFTQMSADFEKAVTAADRLRRTSQPHTQATGYQDDLIRAVDNMQKLQAELQAQFLALQNQIQQQSRQYQTISNALQARHQIAMNSIRNMK